MKTRLAILCLIFCPLIVLGKISFDYTLTGLNGSLYNNAKSRLDIELGPHKNLTRQDIEVFFQSAPKNIKLAIAPYGYFSAVVKSSLTHKGHSWHAQFTVKTKQPVVIKRLQLKIIGPGRHDAAINKFTTDTILKAGDRLNTEKYQEIKKQMFARLRERGYLQAELIKDKLFVNRQKHCANIQLAFKTGPRFRFGKVTFSQGFLNDAFLHRYVPFKKLEYYSDAKLQQFQDALNGSGYFHSEKITPRLKNAQHAIVPIYVKLNYKNKSRYDFGVGYGTDTGIRGLFGIELRHITKSGQHFEGKVHASQVNSTISASYVIPGKNPDTSQYRISTQAAHLNQDLGTSNAQNISLSYTRVFHGWQQRFGAKVLNELSTLESDPTLKNVLLFPYASTSLLISDHLHRPNQGYRLSFTAQAAPKYGTSTASFFQTLFQSKYLHTFHSVNTRVLLSLQLGLTATKNIRLLPFSLQNFAGGLNSVRGFRYNSIGPGEYLTVANVELQQQIIKDWYLVGLIDSGSVSNTLFSNLHTGAGGGVMWRSPVGAIEFTAAHALHQPTMPWLFQFSMGAEL